MLHDETRCHDIRCTVREQCERWTKRDHYGIHAATLKSMWIPHHCPCSHYLGDPIEVEDA